MNQTKLTSLGALAALALLAACDEGMDFGDMTGTIFPTVRYDATVVGAPGSRSVKEFSDLTVEDLTLTLTSADGKLSEEFSAAAFPVDRGFAIGKYTMTASYGDINDEGFEKPAVFGQAEFTVSEGKASQVALTAKPSKAMVSIAYDESLLNYMTSFSASLHSAGGQTISYSADETRYAYLKPGEITVDVTFTKPNGKGGTLEAAKFTAEAQHRYTLTVKLGGGGAGEVSSLEIDFDETLEQETVDLDISDEILMIPAPEITLSGVLPGETLSLVQGSRLAEPLRVDINARGGIASAVLTTTGNSVNIPAEWPTEIDLAKASASEQETLKSFGFKNIGIFNNPGHLAAFDLSAVIEKFPATDENAEPVTFALKVTDNNGKVASEEPLTFNVKIDKLALDLEAIEGYAYAGEETADVLVSYNGNRDIREAVTINYLATSGGMKPTEIVSVETYSRSSQIYQVSVKIHDDAQMPLILQAQTGDITTDDVEVPQATVPVVTCNENDVFAKNAWVKVSSEDYDVATKQIAIEVKETNGKFVKVSGNQNGEEFHITGGLKPGTTYLLRAKLGALVSEAITITTEAAEQIPGGDMEEWGECPVTKKGSYSWTNYSLISPWAGFNNMTLSVTTERCQRSGGETLLRTDDNHSGNNAAIVRTVGWNASMATKQPSVQTAGELFLGTFSYSGNTPNPTYGTTFSSRPTALTFWYKYSEYKAGEKGLAEIKVLDAEGNVLGEGSATYGKQDSYVQATIPVIYTSARMAKAASIQVKFCSADGAVNSTNVPKLSTGALDISGWGQRCDGASFYIDDVELVY